MRLAIGSGTAFRTVLARHGSDVFDRPDILGKSLRWWAGQGVEGIALYDTFPDFYQRSDASWHAIKTAVDEAGLQVAAFNALRKSYFLPELEAQDVVRTEHCLHVCSILRPGIFDVSANVPFPHQRDPQTMAARPLFRGKYAAPDDYERAAARMKWLAKQSADL